MSITQHAENYTTKAYQTANQIIDTILENADICEQTGDFMINSKEIYLLNKVILLRDNLRESGSTLDIDSTKIACLEIKKIEKELGFGLL